MRDSKIIYLSYAKKEKMKTKIKRKIWRNLKKINKKEYIIKLDGKYDMHRRKTDERNKDDSINLH